MSSSSRKIKQEPSSDEKNEVENPSWIQRFVALLRGHHLWQDEVLQRRVCAGFLLSALALMFYRRRRALQRIAYSAIHRPVYYTSSTVTPFSLLYRAAREGRVEKALFGASGVFYYYLEKDQKWRKSTLPAGDLQKELIKTLSQTCPDVSALPESLASRLVSPTLAALPFVYLALLYRMMSNLNDPTGNTKLSSSANSTAQNTTTTFAHVAGIDQACEEVSEVVEYLRHPTRRRLGARAPRAILLYGPPGTGKTLLAQAVAGEAAVDAFGACTASVFVELYVGRGAARVRKLFADLRQEARRAAARAPNNGAYGWSQWLSNIASSRSNKTKRCATAILFIDELDALAKTRSTQLSSDEREQTLNQLLTEMDGFDRDDDDVTLVVIAASNRIDVLDPAILRRFERHVHVGYPDAHGREAILKVHAKRIDHDDDIDWIALAKDEQSAGFSGADIRNLVNEAALLAVREGSQAVEQSHLEHAARRIREMKQNDTELNVTLPFALR